MGEKVFYPCIKCGNERHHSVNDIRSHLICHEIISNYTKWTWHGELWDIPIFYRTEAVDEDIKDRIEEMIRDLGQDYFQQACAPLYDKIESDSKKPLYSGCTTFTRLSTMLAFVNIKARFVWSHKSFTELLVLLKKMLPEENTLPKNHYEVKKILCPMGMEYQKIHACLNDFILYKNKFAEMCKRHTCGVPRYKLKDDECSNDATTNNSRPTDVCWYLPIIWRFKRLFDNGHDAKNLTCHEDDRKSDGLLWHLADSLLWKQLIVCIHILGTSQETQGLALLCMMIVGPRKPGNDIDVYLTPLIEDLRKLWEDRVDVWDGNRQHTFKLRVMVFYIINDFPAYENL